MMLASCGWFRRPSWIAFFLSAIGLTGCIVVRVPAKAEVSRAGDVGPTSGAMTLSVVFSPDFSPGTPPTLGTEMIECVRRGLVQEAPDVRLVSHEDFRRVVFPGLRPAEVRLRADTLPLLLARTDIRERLDQLRLTHVLLVGGMTERAATARGVALPNALIIGGGQRDQTRLTASLFELTRGTQVSQVTATAAGQVHAGAVLPIPLILGGGTDAEAPSCQALGIEAARAIREKRGDGTR